MTRGQIEKRLETICGKLETLQSDVAGKANREVSEAIADAKKSTLRALRKIEVA